jgi:hypothetical protein
VGFRVWGSWELSWARGKGFLGVFRGGAAARAKPPATFSHPFRMLLLVRGGPAKVTSEITDWIEPTSIQIRLSVGETVNLSPGRVTKNPSDVRRMFFQSRSKTATFASLNRCDESELAPPSPKLPPSLKLRRTSRRASGGRAGQRCNSSDTGTWAPIGLRVTSCGISAYRRGGSILNANPPLKGWAIFYRSLRDSKLPDRAGPSFAKASTFANASTFAKAPADKLADKSEGGRA